MTVSDEDILNGRQCYCSPESDCGELQCAKCGEMGVAHACHYPGPVPVTAAWCDSCYVQEYLNPIDPEKFW